jgi:hypothetical protein
MTPITVQRQYAVESMRAKLVRRTSPRMHMLGLVVVTGGVGFLASYALLHAGVRSMALRYPVATCLGYAAFLGLIRLWIRRYRVTAKETSQKSRYDFDLDLTDVPIDQLFSSPADGFDGFGRGGGFSGGGGGSDWGTSSVSSHAVASPPVASGGGGSGASGGGGWSLDLDLDEGAVWLVPIAIIAAIVLSVVIYVLYLAPTLFAELLLDAGLAAGLYRKLIRTEPQSWLRTAVRRTVAPALFVAGLLALAGTIMQRVYPDAASIGVVVHHLQETKRRSAHGNS